MKLVKNNRIPKNHTFSRILMRCLFFQNKQRFLNYMKLNTGFKLKSKIYSCFNNTFIKKKIEIVYIIISMYIITAIVIKPRIILKKSNTHKKKYDLKRLPFSKLTMPLVVIKHSLQAAYRCTGLFRNRFNQLKKII